MAIYYRDAAKQFMLENPSVTDIYLRTREQIENKIKRLKKSTNLDRKLSKYQLQMDFLA